MLMTCPLSAGSDRNTERTGTMRVAPLPKRDAVSDPRDWVDYYDRGLTKLLSDFRYEAVSNFTAAIK
jgi:hypothetical protein